MAGMEREILSEQAWDGLRPDLWTRAKYEDLTANQKEPGIFNAWRVPGHASQD